jgi:hypothetical protein
MEGTAMAMTAKAQIEMFGTTIEDMQDEMAEAGKHMTYEMYIMSMLSDVQHIMTANPESARQITNKAKWMLSQMHRAKREKGIFEEVEAA